LTPGCDNPVRRGREMIDLLAVEGPKPEPANSYDTAIRAVSYEAAIDQSFQTHAVV
jgi:hypothetical protein